MKNFLRAVRLALGYRLTLVSIVASSLTVAVLWGANIGTVYPFIDVVLRQQPMGKWLAQEMDKADEVGRAIRQEQQEFRVRRAQTWGPAWVYYGMRVGASSVAARVVETAVAGGRWLAPRLPNVAFHSLLLVVAFVLVATLIKCLALALNMILVARVSQLITLDLRNQFYRHMLQMELNVFGQGRTSELMARFTADIGAITYGVWTLFGKTIREPLKMVVCLFGAAMVSWQLLLVSLVLAPLAALLMYFLAKSVKRANRRALEEVAQIYNRLSESFTGIKMVQANTMERVERSRFMRTAKHLYHKSMKIAFYDALVRINNELLGVAVICLALVTGGYLVLNGATEMLGIPMAHKPLTLPGLMLFYGFLIGASDPARKMADVFNELQRASAAADRVYPLLDQQPTIVDPADPKPVPEGACDLVFDNVSFSYLPDQLVLDQIQLRVHAGERLAIVGPNGCGKSTLMNLLLRFYDPVQGSVKLNYTDVREMRLRDLRKKIGLVTQQTLLFDDTIANNIRYGSPHASDEEVVAAARQAQAHRFITEVLDNGYETLVGER
jgi:ATP-binding cassette, subfamily B, bacterial MsbA